MGNSMQKAFFGVIAVGICFIAVELVPISRQAAYWNRCLDNTISWVSESPGLSKWNKKAKESLAVGVCNGAVYEPKLKTTNQSF